MKRLIGLILTCFSFAALGQTLSGTALPAAARTAASVASSDIPNKQWRGVVALTNVATYTSGTYTVKIQGKDPISGNYYDIVTGPALGGTGTTALKVYPGITPATNVSVADVLPSTWRVTLTGASTPSMSLSVSFTLVP